MNISDKAVEAAAKRLAVIGGHPNNWAHYRAPAIEAIEAAAPHLMAVRTITTAEELDQNTNRNAEAGE